MERKSISLFIAAAMAVLSPGLLTGQSRMQPGSLRATTARVELCVKTAGAEKSGYQMLLDANANTWWAQLWNNDPVKDEFYPLFEYKIPANADGNPKTVNVIYAGKDGFAEIPAGKYDFCIVNPVPNVGVRVVPGSSGIGNDFTFEAGKTYVYYVEAKGAGDFVRLVPELDADLARLILPAASLGLGATEKIQVELKNAGLKPFSGATVSYAVNGGAPVEEVCAQTIEPGGSYIYTFKKTADFSASGVPYPVKATVTLTGDGNDKNNAKQGGTKRLQVLTLPLREKFNSADDFAKSWSVIDLNGDSKTWEWAGDKPGKDGAVGVARYSNGSVAADDYLISDPITFAAGDNYLSFYFRSYNDNPEYAESLSVFYGKDIEHLTPLWANDSIVSSEWKFGLIDFRVAEAGNYRIFFQANSKPDKWKLYIDDIEANAGQSPGLPDIAVTRLILPLSSCDISAASKVGAVLQNKGKKDIQTFTLTLKCGKNAPVVEQFERVIKPEESVEVLFNAPVNFSDKGIYSVTIEAASSGDNNTGNNSLAASIENGAPMQIPLLTNFSKTEEQPNWRAQDLTSWYYNEGFCLARAQNVPLVSKCVTMEAGAYSLAYSYVAGIVSSLTFEETPDDFYIAIGKAGTDYTSWRKIEDVKEALVPNSTMREVLFTIPETDQYELAIVSTNLHRLGFANINLRRLPENDLRVYGFVPQIPAQVPVSQINGSWVCDFTLQNRGQKPAENVVATLMCGKSVIGSATPTTIASTREVAGTVDGVISGISDLGTLLLTAKASMDAQDEDPKNNMAEYKILVTDSVLAYDTHKTLDAGIGSDVTTLNLGTVYRIQSKGVISSVGVGFLLDEKVADNRFGVAVYTMDEQDKLTEIYSGKEFLRGKGNTVNVVDIPDLTVNPGRIFVEVRQLVPNMLGLSVDNSPGGYIMRNLAGKLVRIDGFGYPVIRPYFGPQANGVSMINQHDNIGLRVDPAAQTAEVYTEDTEILAVYLIDMSGKVVICQEACNAFRRTISLNGLPVEAYILKVVTGKGSKTFKFINR